MSRLKLSRQILILLGGDISILAVVTVIGFASHGTAGTAGVRMLSTFIPLVVAWLIYSPLLQVYNIDQAAAIKQLWRPFYAMVLATPFAAWLRGVWLNSPILPIFVVVLGGFSAFGILAWRFLFALVARPRD